VESILVDGRKYKYRIVKEGGMFKWFIIVYEGGFNYYIPITLDNDYLYNKYGDSPGGQAEVAEKIKDYFAEEHYI
jgi:hypothetical protein